MALAPENCTRMCEICDQMCETCSEVCEICSKKCRVGSKMRGTCSKLAGICTQTCEAYSQFWKTAPPLRIGGRFVRGIQAQNICVNCLWTAPGLGGWCEGLHRGAQVLKFTVHFLNSAPPPPPWGKKWSKMILCLMPCIALGSVVVIDNDEREQL